MSIGFTCNPESGIHFHEGNSALCFCKQSIKPSHEAISSVIVSPNCGHLGCATSKKCILTESMTSLSVSPQRPGSWKWQNDISQESKDQTQKKDAGKVPMELISPVAMEVLARVLGFGAKKYEDHGWRKGIKWTRTIAAILRHTYAYLRGETNDPETGLSHMGHVMCEAMFLIEWETTHPELDDRYRIL